jgi:hypothetical protein
MEGKLLPAALDLLMNEDGLELQVARKIQRMMQNLSEMVSCLGFCLSQNGDILSQWRGYANDAEGISVGFSSNYLKWLYENSKVSNFESLILSRVKYSPKEHTEIISDFYRKLKAHAENGAFNDTGRTTLFDDRSVQEIEEKDSAIRKEEAKAAEEFVDVIRHLFSFKSEAFKEEAEWRLMSFMFKGIDEKTCDFRISRGQIIPFRVLNLKEAVERDAIVEIVIGPKNRTPRDVIANLLAKHGFEKIEIRASAATYR